MVKNERQDDGASISGLRAGLAPLRNRAIIIVIVASIIAAGGRGLGVLTTYVPLYLTRKVSLPLNIVAILFTLLLVGSVVGSLGAGRLSDRLGRIPMLLLSYGTAAAFFILLPILAQNHAPLWLLTLEIALLGLTAYAESPLLQALLADVAPARDRDGAFAWYFTLAFGLGSLWGTIMGAVIDRAGFEIAFVIMAASYVAASVILLFLPRTTPAQA
jgi:MFS family permease